MMNEYSPVNIYDYFSVSFLWSQHKKALYRLLNKNVYGQRAFCEITYFDWGHGKAHGSKLERASLKLLKKEEKKECKYQSTLKKNVSALVMINKNWLEFNLYCHLQFFASLLLHHSCCAGMQLRHKKNWTNKKWKYNKVTKK